MKRYKVIKNKKVQKQRKESFFSKVCNTFITLILTVGMLWGLQAYSTSSGLKFVQLSDIHYLDNGSNTTFKMTGESPTLLDDAINQINEENDVDFVMITGDLIDKPFEKELKAFLEHMNNLKYPWYFAFGNHDRCVGGYLTTDVYMDMVKESNPNYQFKNSYYSFSPKKGYKVIVLDDIITEEITSQGFIPDEEYKWLEKELNKSKNQTVLIFMHIPVIEPFASPNHRLRNSSKIMSLIESYKNPIGVFQGHYHAAKITQHNNVLYVNSPALVSYPDAFRIINVTNYKDRAVFDLRWVETKEKTIQKMAKLLLFNGLIYTGENNDQSGIFELKRL